MCLETLFLKLFQISGLCYRLWIMAKPFKVGRLLGILPLVGVFTNVLKKKSILVRKFLLIFTFKAYELFLMIHPVWKNILFAGIFLLIGWTSNSGLRKVKLSSSHWKFADYPEPLKFEINGNTPSCRVGVVGRFFIYFHIQKLMDCFDEPACTRINILFTGIFWLIDWISISALRKFT